MTPARAGAAGTILLLAHLDGAARTRDRLERAAAMLRTSGHAVETIGTDAAPEPGPVPWGAALQRRLERARTEGQVLAAVVAVGGDGIVHTAVNALMRDAPLRGAGGPDLPVPLGVIPGGSGNDLARHHRVPEADPEGAAGRVLRRLDEGASPMDLGRLEFPDGRVRWFATAVCCGIDAAVSERASSWRRPRGSTKYLAALAVEIARHRSVFYDVAVSEPGGRERLRARRQLMLTVANTSSIGGGLPVMPGADPHDGVLELLEVRALSRPRILRLLPHLLAGTHLGLAEVEAGPALRVEIDAPARITADGESMGPGPVTVTVAPAALPVLL